MSNESRLKNLDFIIMSKYDFPICFNFPSGHIDDNRAVIFGAESQLNIAENNVFLEQ